MTMRDTLTLLNQVSGVTEELGALGEVPSGWIKLLTSRGAGDQSQIVPIKKGLRSTRDMGATIKGLENSGEFAGLFLKKSDGTPVGIIKFTGEGGKPWQFITPSGEAVTRNQYYNRALPRWKRTGNPQDRWKRDVGHYKVSDMSLNDLSSHIPIADGIDLYGIKKDTNRAAVQQQRQATRAGRDSDIEQIKKGAAQKFVANKASGSIEALKKEIAAVADAVRAKLEKVTSQASSGEYLSRDTDLLSRQQVDQLNSMLYDLASLSRHAQGSVEKGVRSRHMYRRGRTYEYDDLLSDLDRIKVKLDKLNASGRYEAKAKQLVNTVIENARKK